MEEPRFYIGLDAHKETVAYCVRDKKGPIVLEGECAAQYRDLKSLLEPYLSHAETVVESCSVAYKVYTALKADGYDIVMANVIQLRQLVAKNDALDARRLSDMLRMGGVPTSYIPDERVQHLRTLVLARHNLMEEKVRWKNRIQAFLDREGVSFASCCGRPFTKKWMAVLDEYLNSSKANEIIREANACYRSVKEREERWSELLVAATREQWAEEHNLLQGIPGIGPMLACYCIAEITPIHRFASKKKLRRYAGVVAVIKQSGKSAGMTMLPKFARRRLLCWALVQAANSAGRTKTNLGRYYQRKKKQKKIAAMAKMATAAKISDIVYHVLSTGKPYTPKAS